MKRHLILLSILLITSTFARGQFLMDMIDTTTDMGKGLLSIYQKFNLVTIGGYIQPQFQYIQEKGAATYNGGNFERYVNNRFMIRRGRFRFDYARYNDLNKPVLHFVIQIDGTERGVGIRDLWGRYYENKLGMFAATAGMFARPFGYEVNLSSSDRESPERGRMSQILMKSERDLGAMLTFEPKEKTGLLKYLAVDAGLFNGQGLAGPADYDSYKDFIARAKIKPYPIRSNLFLSAGISYLNGGFVQNSKYVNTIHNENGHSKFVTDSSENNIGEKAPRKYYGADAQLKIRHSQNSTTELRAEYWQGTQTSTALFTETPPTLLPSDATYYVRNFNGAFFYLLHTIHKKHQVGIKYDWYDPNTKVAGKEIGDAGNGTTLADIKYSTLGIGYINYVNSNMKLVLWYDMVKNESTSLPAFGSDLRDNIFTCRLQFRF